MQIFDILNWKKGVKNFQRKFIIKFLVAQNFQKLFLRFKVHNPPSLKGSLNMKYFHLK